MSKSDEQGVSKMLSQGLGIVFENTKYCLDGWGKVDNWATLSNEAFLFVEVETKQKHPCTNVSKLWPYLEQYKTKRIFLVQAFFPDSPGLKNSRGRLGELVIVEGTDFSGLGSEIKRFKTLH